MSHGELSDHAAGQVLNHVRHKVGTQLDVGAPVAPHVVVIGRREESEDLNETTERRDCCIFNFIVML